MVGGKNQSLKKHNVIELNIGPRDIKKLVIECIGQSTSHKGKGEEKTSGELVDVGLTMSKKVLEEKVKKEDELACRMACQEKESKTNHIPIQVDINMVMISEVIDKATIEHKDRLAT